MFLSKRFAIVAVLVFICVMGFAQRDSLQNKSIVKQDWSLGALPVVAYNSDVGLRYGALVNLFDFGDGTRYPNYDQSLYFEWSQTTKGSRLFQVLFDTKVLIPNTRLTSEISYKTEQAMDFYGFNGYGSYYSADFEDDEHSDYLSRMFYRIHSQSFMLKSDLQVNLAGEKVRALGGISFFNVKTSEVDVDKLNKGQSEVDKLPTHDEQPGLYRYYVDAGIISEEEKAGAANLLVKVGGIIDTRDAEANPGKGILAESFVLANLGVESSSYGKLILNWHQYKTLLPRKVSLAYRLSYQPKVWGDIPWYMLPYIYNSRRERYGLGGIYSLRGIIRNRVVGDGVAFANMEIRSVLFRTVIKKQNFYLGFVPFVDMGMVTEKVDVDYSLLPTDVRMLIQPQTDKESIHLSYGAELKFVLNDNFIVSASYGKAADKRDGTSGFYIDLNYMF